MFVSQCLLYALPYLKVDEEEVGERGHRSVYVEALGEDC